MINTNIESLNAQNNLERTEASIATSMQHLSSGLRVNIAGDDVAAYGIGQRIQGQLNGINQAHQNTQDAVSLTQTAQGALNTVQQILQRVRTLAVENANGTLSKEDKEAVKKAAEELTTELKRIGETTTFNEVKLLASEEEIKFQVGGNEKESIGVKTTKLEEAIKGVKVEEIKTVDEAINKVSKAAAEFGSIQNR
ncbi:MAG TPA: flagellin FliC, partial [Solirubrobacteraceae bacterium]|nr:flagellin FliC [Solirubrobacteraceae bacterium]